MSESEQPHTGYNETQNSFTMVFADSRLEDIYTSLRSENVVNAFARGMLIFLCIVIEFRRLQLLIGSYSDSFITTTSDEIRLFTICTVALALELLTHYWKRLTPFRCFMITALIYYTSADGSVTYYLDRVKDEPIYAFR